MARCSQLTQFLWLHPPKVLLEQKDRDTLYGAKQEKIAGLLQDELFFKLYSELPRIKLYIYKNKLNTLGK